MDAMEELCFDECGGRRMIHAKVAAQDIALLLRLPPDDVVLERNRRAGCVL
jgi:hypothetical protein